MIISGLLNAKHAKLLGGVSIIIHQPNDISNRFVDTHPAPNTVILTKNTIFFRQKLEKLKHKGSVKKEVKEKKDVRTASVKKEYPLEV